MASILTIPSRSAPRLGGLARTSPTGLPGLSEPETMRHYVRLSRMNYGIDTGPFPLGSCTMKHNPRLNEKIARLGGLADIHPLQPLSTVPGALAVLAEIGAVALSTHRHEGGRVEPEGRCPRRTLRADGDQGGVGGPRRGVRSIVLVPQSAHGTNPARRGPARLPSRGHSGPCRWHGRPSGITAPPLQTAWPH